MSAKKRNLLSAIRLKFLPADSNTARFCVDNETMNMRLGRFAAFAACVIVASAVPVAAATSYQAAGSTAMGPLVKAAASSFESSHPGVHIAVRGGGSRVGVADAAADVVNFGLSDVPPTNFPSLVDYRICVVPFIIVANASVGVTTLTKMQIHDLFSGRITNWRDVGGADQQVVLINRPRASGTRAVFAKLFMGSDQISSAGSVQDSSKATVALTHDTPGAVAYLTFAAGLQKGLGEMKIDGAEPTVANVEAGSYPFWGYEHVVTRGRPSKEMLGFIDSITKDRSLLESLGYIDISNMRVNAADR